MIKLSELLGTEFPIIQGGMANIATGEFAAACSNAGALGVIATGGMLEADLLRQQIRICKSLTDKPFGVNLMLMSPYADDIAQIILEEGVKVVTTGAGVPSQYVPAWKEAGIKVFPVVPATTLVRRLAPLGVDGFIAECRPEDKIKVIKEEQAQGKIVAMTGDGTNDAPALAQADVAAAMNTGTQAAKEAGKIVILDDNFKSIKDAIWYGRTIYHNILKFCRFQLVINVAAVVVSAIAPFFGVEEPLKVTHLLFVNLVMDGLGAIMLGNEPAQERYMSEPPRRRDESIVSKSMMAQIVTMGLWLTALSFVFLKVPFFDSFFASTEQKLSAYFVLFIWSALFNAFNVRSDSFDIFKDLKLNPGFMRVFVIIVLVQAFIVNAALIPVPVFGWISNMFSCVPFPPAGWAAAILLAFTMIPVDILRKVIVGRK